MSDEDWVKEAIMDDSVVVELLMRLHHAAPPPPTTTTKRDCSPGLSVEWSIRQRRSKPMLLVHSNTATKKKKKEPTPRDSPTTPLSWSGATSVSGGGCAVEGFEESSQPPPQRPDDARSKVTATSGATSNKRSRKKKSLAELKDKETQLLKERKHLKRDLAALLVTMEKHRATNESLKRLKLDLESQPAAERDRVFASVEARHDQTHQKEASCDPSFPSTLRPEDRIGDHEATSKQQSSLNKFLLPDLNLPVEDSNSEMLDRVS